MYRLFIADDEPMAIAMLAKILEKHCPDFQVCGTAENGRQAMEEIRRLKPDVILTDIEMPQGNGIDVAQMVHEELPESICVIISGYENFAYAQGAIRANAADYMLKPVIPSALRKTMDALKVRLDAQMYEKRNRAVKAICSGDELPLDQLKELFPYEHLMLGLVRRNGLPVHFGPFAGKEIYAGENESFSVYGRDEMESLYIIPTEMMGQTMHQYLTKTMARQSDGEEYYTGIYFGKSFAPEELTARIREMYTVLDRTCTIGKTQLIEAASYLQEHKEEQQEKMSGQAEEVFYKSVENLLQMGKPDALRQTVTRMFETWKEQEMPQYQIKYNTFRLRYLFDHYLGLSSQDAVEEEYLLNDAFTNAPSADDFLHSLLEILFRGNDSKEAPKIDSPEFFREIEQYMTGNMKEALSLVGICKTFGVSQTYISKLFRKYCGLSFNQKLTEIRMEKAKELIRTNPEIFIKDVATMVGYADQFYFSRVFRSYTGKSPSEFMG